MKVAKSIWRFLVGGATVAVGWFLVQPNLTSTSGQAPIQTIVGVSLVAVGISVLSAVFD